MLRPYQLISLPQELDRLMYEQLSAIVKYRRSAKTGGSATSLIPRRVTLTERQVRKREEHVNLLKLQKKKKCLTHRSCRCWAAL